MEKRRTTAIEFESNDGTIEYLIKGQEYEVEFEAIVEGNKTLVEVKATFVSTSWMNVLSDPNIPEDERLTKEEYWNMAANDPRRGNSYLEFKGHPEVSEINQAKIMHIERVKG